MDNIASDSENKILNIKKQQYSKPNFNWKDPLNLEDLLTEEEKLIRNTASDYAQEKLMPRSSIFIEKGIENTMLSSEKNLYKKTV